MFLFISLNRILLLGLFLCGWGTIVASNMLWEYSPYRIRVQPELTESASRLLGIPSNQSNDVLNLLQSQLPGLTNNWFGNHWVLTLESEPYHRPDPEKEGTPEFDKITTVVIDAVGDELHVTGRELDMRTHHLNVGATQVLYHPSELVLGVALALKSCFAPIALIEKPQGNDVLLKLRGGAIPTQSGEDMLSQDTLFIPFERRYNRLGELETAQPLPWTALSVQSQEGGTVHAQVQSSIPYSLKTRGNRGRTELVAIAPRLTREPSQLTFVPRYLSFEENRRPDRIGFLPLLQIYEKADSAVESTLDKMTTAQGVLVGETNFDGQWTVPYLENKPLRLLSVKQGGILLARLMLVQGFERHYEVPIADDEVRISASAVLLGIQDELADQQIREEILKIRADKQRASGDTEGFNRTTRELQRSRTRAQFLAQVETERRRHQSPDTLVQRRMDSMFDRTKQLIEKSLPNEE